MEGRGAPPETVCGELRAQMSGQLSKQASLLHQHLPLYSGSTTEAGPPLSLLHIALFFS